MTLPGVLIASRISSTGVGGLANYQRRLGAELQARSMAQVSFFCSENILSPSLWMNLAPRAWTHVLLEKLIVHHYAPKLPTSKPNAVHFVGTGWDFTGFAMHAFARKAGARFTVWPAVHPGQWGDDRLDLWLYQKADAVMCQSDGEARILIERGLDPKKIVRCGLPPMCLSNGDGERLRTELHMGNRTAVLFLGRRDEGKGYPLLLRAWPRILEKHPQAILLLGGPGGKEYDPERLALPPDSIRDLATPSERALADALASCDIFCMPSAHESFGIVYVEAWSYGKPVICGGAPASRELVRNGETGLWADQTVESVTDALLKILDHPETGRRMGDAGRQYQQAHFTWEKILEIHRAAFGLLKA